MPPLAYDEKELVKSLDRLAAKHRAAFAAACAQRLLPAYEAFWSRSHRGDARRIASILERLWGHLVEAAPLPSETLQADLETCMSLIPAEDEEPWLEEQPYAEDAASALAYALRALSTGKSQEAAWAARCSYETVDHHLTHRVGIDTALPGGEEKVRLHPLMQAELSRQRRDLEELLRAADSTATSVIVRLRLQAQDEGAHLFEAGGAGD